MESSIMRASPPHNEIVARTTFPLRKFVWYVQKHCTITAWSIALHVRHCSGGPSLHDAIDPAPIFATCSFAGQAYFSVLDAGTVIAPHRTHS